MEVGDRGGGEDRAFSADFTADGAALLKERVMEKLKEYMGDYTDDVLVEYIIVLLRNGRRKDEARRELNVFLGDDSDSFVSWLWDHLSSSLHLYVQPKVPVPVEATEIKPKSSGHSAKGILKMESDSGSLLSDPERQTSTVSKSRRNRDWKEHFQESEPFTFRSSMNEITYPEDRIYSKRQNFGRRSPSPKSQLDKKRSRQDEHQPAKRDSSSFQTLNAPRRLLQFAVRDAVRTVQQSSAKLEPSSKRLRSVVSTSTSEDVLEERPQRRQAAVRMPVAASTAIKAAAEAAEDVIKTRRAGNVFDRLGRVKGSKIQMNEASEYRDGELDDEEYEDREQLPTVVHGNYYRRSEVDEDGDMSIDRVPSVADLAVDSASDNDGYDDIDIVGGQTLLTSHSAIPGNKDAKPVVMKYNVAQDDEEVGKKTRSMEQDSSAVGAAKSSSKIVNISVNVNTWKPPHYQEPRAIAQANAAEKVQVNAGKSSVVINESATLMPEKGMDMTSADVRKDAQRSLPSISGSYATSRPSDDVDSRTLFVGNVHFAATKDTLSRHFNKFGEVLKVIIMTDPTTGQPTGSAYVEFLRKESAEHALSLNGTSFMSRILKVVRRSAPHQEAAAVMGWRRVTRASPFAPRPRRMPYPRGPLATATFRPRLPIKTGARSLQWKREVSGPQDTNSPKAPKNASTSILSPTGRNLTYIRTECKADGSSGAS